MTERRKTEHTDLAYSYWHRTQQIRKYFGEGQEATRRAAALGMIDIDAVEYCRKCNDPLALIETQRSVQPPKSAMVTRRVAEMAGIECWSMSFRVIDDLHVDEDHKADIIWFQRQRLWPPGDDTVIAETPREFAAWLESLRVPHRCKQ